MGGPDNSISIIIAALNEETLLEKAVTVAIEAARRCFDRYEIIIVNDGSTDGTADVATRLCQTLNHVSVVHHDRPRCLGAVFRVGLSRARMSFVTLIHAKEDTTPAEWEKVWSLRGRADLIVPYTVNGHERPLVRRIISRGLTLTISMLFGLRLRYYMHHALHKRWQLKAIEIRTDSYAYQAEILVKLLAMGCSYIEVGKHDKLSGHNPTRSYRMRNILGVLKCLIWTAYDIYGTGRYSRQMNLQADVPGGE